MTERKPDAANLESTVLYKQAVWCGVVCALAVVITALNALPPIEVQYRVRNQVLVTQPRLEKLKRVLEQDLESTTRGKLRYAQLSKLKVLDNAGSGDSILVQVDSLWTGRTSQLQVQAWLEKVSRAELQRIVHTDEARATRFAAWQAETAKHYLQHHRYLNSPKTTTAIAGNSANNVNAQLTSYNSKQKNTQAKTVANTADEPTANIDLQLTESVKKSEAEQKKAKAQLSEALDKYAGPIELVGAPKITSKTRRIPGWMCMSVLLLGLASGSIASWLQYRLQTRGTYDPQFVANQLAIDGLPIAGSVEISPLVSKSDRGSHDEGATHFLIRIAGNNLSRVSEGLLTVWCVAIVARMLFDPMWRSVAIDSPLAAFGRLFAGLP